MFNQNSYSKTQYCIRCKNPLEKARTMNVGRGICQKCQRLKQKERLAKNKISMV